MEAPIKEWADVVRANVKVPKRKPTERVRKDAPSTDWVDKKRRQGRRVKSEKQQRKHGVLKEQQWLMPMDKPLPVAPTPVDTADRPAESAGTGQRPRKR